MSIQESIYFRFNQKRTGRVLDGNSKGRVYTLAWNKGDYQRWVFEDLGDGYYKIKQKKTGRVLDGNSKGKVYTLAWNGGDYQRWSLEDLGDGYYMIKQKRTGRVLDANSKGKMYTLAWNGGDYQKWALTIAADKWHVTEEDIVYEKTQLPTNMSKKDIISRKVWVNDSPAKITETIKQSKTKSSTFEWSLKETLKVGMKNTVKANIFFLKADTEISVEIGLESSQRWSDTVSETYEVSRTITLNERSAIEVHAYIDWIENFKTPFTLKMWVSANADTTSGPDFPLSSQLLESLLNDQRFSGKVIDRSVPNKLQVSLSGEFIGSFGLDTHVNIKEIPLSKAPYNAINVAPRSDDSLPEFNSPKYKNKIPMKRPSSLDHPRQE